MLTVANTAAAAALVGAHLPPHASPLLCAPSLTPLAALCPIPHAVCDVFVDDLKESILDLRQAQLETVVPAAEGTPVLVLAGALRGKRGRLLARNTGASRGCVGCEGWGGGGASFGVGAACVRASVQGGGGGLYI